MQNTASGQMVPKNSNEWLEFWISDEILFGRYHDQAYIDLAAAKKILADRISFCNGKSYPSLVDARKVRYWTREARSFMASPENNKYFKAIGVLVDSKAAEIMLKYYMYFNKPAVPTKPFRDENEAIRWLQQFK